MGQNRFETYSRGVTAPASDAFPITPDDGADLDRAVRAIYVGGAGNLSIVTLEGSTVTFTGLSGSMVLPVSSVRVLTTGTTATGLVGLV